MTDTPIGWSFLYSRRWIGYVAMLVVFSIICVWLGNWQFARRAEAHAEIQRIDANYDAPAIPLTEAVPDPSSFDTDTTKWQTVELHGEYLGEPYLARNRPGPQGVGSNLIQAFRNSDGSILFIDRGWIPVSGTDQVPVELPSAADGMLTVQARLLGEEPEIPGRSSAGRFVASINLAELSRLAAESELINTSATVYSATYGQLISETPTGEHGALSPRPERDEGPHLSYALQWYVFIIIAVIGVGYAARQEYRNLNAESDAVKRENARRAQRRKQRGPSDADEEDALIEGQTH